MSVCLQTQTALISDYTGRLHDTVTGTSLKLKQPYDRLLHYVGMQNDLAIVWDQ